MSRRVLLGVLVILIATFASFTFATEQQLATLRFAVIDLPPYGCKNENRQPVCYHNAYIVYLSQALGIPVDVFSAPPQRARFSVENGRADFLITINHQEMMRFAEAITIVSEPMFTVIAKKGITQEVDLAGKPFALIRGGNYLSSINQNKRLNKVFTSSHDQSIGMLLKGRVDAAVAPQEIIDILLDNSSSSANQFDYPMPSWSIPSKLYCRKRLCNEALKQKIRDITQTIPEALKKAWLETAKEHARQHYSKNES